MSVSAYSNEQFIKVRDLKIFYTECNPSKKDILFFIHGNSSSRRIWDLQMMAQAYEEYRLVAFDLPGHGASSWSENPLNDYSAIGMGEILSSAVKQLVSSTDTYFLLGFCFGSNIIGEMLADSNITPRGIVLISTNILGGDVRLENIFKENHRLELLFKDESVEDQVRDLWQGEAGTNELPIQILIDDHLSVDKNFRSTLADSVIKKKYSDEISIIKQRMIPVLIVFGETDTIVNINYLDKKVQEWKIVKIQDAGHLVHIVAADKVNQIILEFCNDSAQM